MRNNSDSLINRLDTPCLLSLKLSPDSRIARKHERSNPLGLNYSEPIEVSAPMPARLGNAEFLSSGNSGHRIERVSRR